MKESKQLLYAMESNESTTSMRLTPEMDSVGRSNRPSKTSQAHSPERLKFSPKKNFSLIDNNSRMLPMQ